MLRQYNAGLYVFQILQYFSNAYILVGLADPFDKFTPWTASQYSDYNAILAVTKEMILDNKAIQWNRNPAVTILIACATSNQNCSRGISIPLDCFVVKGHFLSN